ncbi:MAG: Peptidase, family, partial [Myxococcaceae bacterium]|nr:Peptidase, family [Myxococcaceae bacterium]
MTAGTREPRNAFVPRLPRRLTSTLLLFVAILLFALVRYAPPEPRGVDAPLDVFSAMRAREAQKAISGDGQSRALGTEANVRARGWLEAELAKNGFRTEQESAMSCTAHGACARVVNVVATRAGTDPSAASVLLMAHYDSVPCGPGASDDGMGTATVIEATRAIGAGPPLRRTVVVVLTDGEEGGLLGAAAFARAHPLAKTVHGAVNVDARGTSGPSAMFETSAGNAWIVGLYARRATHPVSSSLFYEIYKRMPNDTDFTAVKDRVHGLNFANIAGVEHYHTPLDSLANADPGTLQHHGDQALAMVRALADAGPELDGPRDPARDAVWFDVLASFVVRWPSAASLGLALLALALVVLSAIRLRTWGVGLAAAGAALVAALAASLLVGAVLRYGGAIPVPWVAHPLPALLSLHIACIAAGLAAARWVGRRASPQVLWAGTWLTWALLGVVTAAFAPGACFLFVVPAFVAGFVSLLRIELATAVPALVAAVLWVPIAILAYDGLGLIVPAIACISSTMLVTTLPALAAEPVIAVRASRKPALAVALLVAALVVVALVVPSFSAAKPQRVNVVLRQDEAADGTTPQARVFVEAAWAYMPWGKPPAAMVAALGDPARVRLEATTPWSTPVPFAEVPRVPLEAPRAVVISSAASPRGRTVRARIESPRGARSIAVLLPATRATLVTVEGILALPHDDMVLLRAVPREGLDVVFEAVGEQPIAITVLDITSGLPPADVAPIAHAVLDARDARATQTQEGDVTMVGRHLDL